MKDLMARLFPIPRSLTGDGVRETLRILGEHIPLNVYEVPSGTKVFDWTVPQEWRFRSARLFDEAGRLVLDADRCPLHVLGYSDRFHGTVDLETLTEHLIVGPESLPDAVPYATSYYEKRWGLCVSWNQRQALKPGRYLVNIDTEHFDGSLTYADAVIPGKTIGKAMLTSADVVISAKTIGEIMLTSYICHPQMANNELSGLVVLAEVVKWWRSKPRLHTLRVLLAPETIGALVYLSGGDIVIEERGYARGLMWGGYGDGNPLVAKRWLQEHVKAGFVLTCLGGPDSFCLQLPRTDNYARRIAQNVMASQYEIELRPWARRGSDERQWCAPGVDLPFATLMKTPPGSPMYPQYHTSADNLDFVTEDQLQQSFELVRSILEAIEGDRNYRTTVTGEPMMSRRGMMPTLSTVGSTQSVRSLMTTLSYCDGRSTLENAEEQWRGFFEVSKEIETLKEHGLVEEWT